MILGFHSIFGAYGFWLPNDPRGSWSDFVASWELFRYGPVTKTATRRSVAGAPHDVAARQRTKEGLKYPPVVLTGTQALAVSHGFADVIRQSGYYLLAARSCRSTCIWSLVGNCARFGASSAISRAAPLTT